MQFQIQKIAIRFFSIRISEFWPSLIVLIVLKVFAQFEPQLFLNCSCFYHVNYTLRHCHKSFSLVFKNTCGTVLIFFSAHLVFLTAQKLARNAICNDVMCCFSIKTFSSVAFESEAEPQLFFIACS